MKSSDSGKPLVEILQEEGVEGTPFNKFFKLMFGLEEENDKKVEDDDCEEDEDDCDEVVSCPECEGALTTVFGSLPLEVECADCKGTYKLRDLI